jgi:hypothetical protein
VPSLVWESKHQGQVTRLDSSSGTSTRSERQQYQPYIEDLLPFYLDLLTLYLVCLDQQAEYDAEDIQVFQLVMELYQLREPPVQEDEDLTQPKAQAELYIMGGFLS